MGTLVRCYDNVAAEDGGGGAGGGRYPPHPYKKARILFYGGTPK